MAGIGPHQMSQNLSEWEREAVKVVMIYLIFDRAQPNVDGPAPSPDPMGSQVPPGNALRQPPGGPPRAQDDGFLREDEALEADQTRQSSAPSRPPRQRS